MTRQNVDDQISAFIYIHIHIKSDSSILLIACLVLKVFTVLDVATFEDLMQFVRKEEGRYACSICNIFSHKWKDNVKNHIESKHYKGVFVHTCAVCGELCQSKNQLQKHRAKYHRHDRLQKISVL